MLERRESNRCSSSEIVEIDVRGVKGSERASRFISASLTSGWSLNRSGSEDSSIQKLWNAPIKQTRPQAHHASTEWPLSSPLECRRPVIVGPKARLRLAVEAAAPLIEPRTLDVGAAFARMMLMAGKVMTWKVILLIRAT